MRRWREFAPSWASRKANDVLRRRNPPGRARDMQDAARWWATNRSPEQANRWLSRLERHLQSLAEMPTRCVLAAENGEFPFELRESHYGAGRRSTHRILFTIADEFVLVLAVRHAAQDRLEPEDLSD